MRKGKGVKVVTRVLNTITITPGSNAGKRKIREIATVESVTPHNRVKIADRLEEVRIPHDDPLVITFRIGTLDVKRMLFDDVSNIDVLFSEAYKAMKLEESRLTLVKTSTYGVGREELPCLWMHQTPRHVRQ